MELKSFKELLLKKSVGNKNLSSFVLNMGEEELTAHVLEALEKMARPTHNMGSKANAVVTRFAKQLDNSDVDQIRDALSHHMSHYRAALRAYHAAPEGSPEKRKMRQVADKHLNKLIPMMHLIARMHAHSDGKLEIDYPDTLAAWEANYTTLERGSNNRYKNDPKLLARRPSPGAKVWPHGTGVPDYRYLEMAPHPGHPHYANMIHEGGYPWEEVRVGSREEIDNGEGYLHIEDIPNKTEYTEHPFDHHPIHAVQDSATHHFTPERLDELAEQLDNWKFSDHHAKWLDMVEEAYNKDPEGFEKRGKVKPPHLYEGLPLHPQLDHAAKHPKPPKRVGQNAASTPESTSSIDEKIQAIKSGTTSIPGVQVRKKPEGVSAGAPTPTTTPVQRHPMEGLYEHYKKLSDNDPLKNIFHGNPAFMQYLESKKGGGN